MKDTKRRERTQAVHRARRALEVSRHPLPMMLVQVRHEESVNVEDGTRTVRTAYFLR